MSINRFHSDSTYQLNVNNTTFSGAVLSATSFPYSGGENTGYVLRVGTAAGDDTSFTPYLMVKAANGNVGIGTATPLEKLDIRGGSISLGEYSTGPVGSRYVGFGYNDGTSYRCIDGMEIENTTLGGNYSQKVHFRTHSYGVSEGRRMTIAEGGNVGIGTTSPTTTLDVNGPATFANPWWIITGSGGNATYTAGQVWGSSAVNGSFYGSAVYTGGGASSGQWNGSTGVFTFPLKGVYSITITMFINATTAGRWSVMNFSSSVSGSSNQYMDFDPSAYTGNNQRSFTIQRYFNANDTFYCNTEGGSITLYWALTHTVFFINKIG
jgi:hypothetical protein